MKIALFNNVKTFIQLVNQSSGSKAYFQGKCYKLDENETQRNPKIETANHRDLEQLIDVFHVIVDINEDDTSLKEFEDIQLERTIKNDQILSQVQKFQANNQELSKKLNDFWLKQQKSNGKINDLEDILELSSIRLFSLKNLKNMLETQLASSITMKNHLKKQKTQNEIEKISQLIENMEKQKKITVKVLEALKITLKLQKAPQQDAIKSTDQSYDYTKWFDSQHQNNNYISTIHKNFSSLKSSIEKMGLSFLKCQEKQISSYQSDVNEQQKIVQNLLNQVNQLNCNKSNTASVDDSYKLVITTLNIQQKTLEILQQALQQIEELKNLSNQLNNTQNKQQAQTQRQNLLLSSQRKVTESQSFSKFQSGQIQASNVRVKTIRLPSIEKTIFQNDTQTCKQLQKKKHQLNSSQLLLEQAYIFFSETLEFVIQNHNRNVEKFLPLKEENFQSQIRSLAFEQFNKSSLQKLAVLINKNFNPNQVNNIFNSKLKQLKNFYYLIS